MNYIKKRHPILKKTVYVNNNKNGINVNAWFNNDCKETSKDFKNARNRYNRNKTTENRASFTRLRTKYNKVKRVAQNKYKTKEGQRVCSLAKNNPKHFWKEIKKFYKKSKNHSNLSAADFLPHFKDLFGNVNTNNEGTHQPDGLSECEMLDREFTVEEIQKVINSLKNNKACGIDNIIGEIFKNCYDLIQPFILKLFNILFKNGIYPESWCTGIISPIYKKGDVDDVKNYRGITLINVIAKIYSHVINNRLLEWSCHNDKIIHNQFGFQPKNRLLIVSLYSMLLS